MDLVLGKRTCGDRKDCVARECKLKVQGFWRKRLAREEIRSKGNSKGVVGTCYAELKQDRGILRRLRDVGKSS